MLTRQKAFSARGSRDDLRRMRLQGTHLPRNSTPCRFLSMRPRSIIQKTVRIWWHLLLGHFLHAAVSYEEDTALIQSNPNQLIAQQKCLALVWDVLHRAQDIRETLRCLRYLEELGLIDPSVCQAPEALLTITKKALPACCCHMTIELYSTMLL